MGVFYAHQSRDLPCFERIHPDDVLRRPGHRSEMAACAFCGLFRVESPAELSPGSRAMSPIRSLRPLPAALTDARARGSAMLTRAGPDRSCPDRRGCTPRDGEVDPGRARSGEPRLSPHTRGRSRSAPHSGAFRARRPRAGICGRGPERRSGFESTRMGRMTTARSAPRRHRLFNNSSTGSSTISTTSREPPAGIRRAGRLNMAPRHQRVMRLARSRNSGECSRTAHALLEAFGAIGGPNQEPRPCRPRRLGIARRGLVSSLNPQPVSSVPHAKPQ